MYCGSNLTAMNSQKWIADSLTALMGEKPYPQITIMDICKRADLSRQTFYNVFDSKEEVLRFCLQSQYEKQFRRFADQSEITLGEIVGAFAVVVAENQILLQRMVENQLDGIIAEEMTKCVSLFAGRFVKQENRTELLAYSEVLLSGALGHLLVYWFRQEKPISLTHLTQLIGDFLQGKLFELS